MDHATRYQGKNLAYLLLAICGPAALLYLRMVFQFAAVNAAWLAWVALAFLLLFFVAQGAGAWYLQRLLPVPRAAWAGALQYAGLFLMGLFFSITGAIMLEAFGYSLWIHVGR